MNDFRKEELEYLLDIVNKFGYSYGCSSKEERTREKLNSLIDNYCEHSWAFYISPHGNTVRCQGCNKGIVE